LRDVSRWSEVKTKSKQRTQTQDSPSRSSVVNFRRIPQDADPAPPIQDQIKSNQNFVYCRRYEKHREVSADTVATETDYMIGH